MKFPIPKTLTVALSPMLLINCIFGLGIIEYPIGRPRRILSAFWSIVNCTIFIGFVIMADFPEIMKGIPESMVEDNNYRINAYVCVVFVAISLCLAQIRAKVVRDNFLTLEGINDRLETLGIPNDYDSLFKAQIIRLGVALVSMFAFMVLDWKYMPCDLLPSESSRIGFGAATYYSLIFAFFVDYTFSGSMRYFSNRFQRLNTNLIESNSRNVAGSTVTQSDSQFQSDDQFPRDSSIIDEIDGNNSQSIRAAKEQWVLHVIRETRFVSDKFEEYDSCIKKKIHRSLCTAATELNRAFGMQMLVSVASVFHLITTFLYTFYVTAITPSENESIGDYWMLQILSIMWLMFFVTRVILMVDTCEATSREANRTAGLLGKLLDTAAHDNDIRNEMNIFSLQLLQNPLNFTAIGFFPLNYSLIHGIIGSVTTYLIIMIQMQSLYKSENMNVTRNSTMLMQTNSTD